MKRSPALALAPSSLSQDVGATVIRAAVFVFAVAWLVTVGVRFGRRLRF